MTTFYRFDIMKNLRIFQFGIVVLLCGILSLPLSAQTEVMAWSNITGVRVDGELIDFESSLRVGTLKGDMEITGKEKQVRPVFHREGDMQEVTTTLRGIKFHQKVTDKGKGLVEISIDALSDTTLNQSAYYCIALSPENYADVKVRTSGRKLVFIFPPICFSNRFPMNLLILNSINGTLMKPHTPFRFLLYPRLLS